MTGVKSRLPFLKHFPVSKRVLSLNRETDYIPPFNDVLTLLKAVSVEIEPIPKKHSCLIELFYL